MAPPAASAAAAADGIHLGVPSCASSTCHGRGAANPSGVRQNEISTWQSDLPAEEEHTPARKHSVAFKLLDGPRGRLIAQKLGIGPAQSAPQCLGCHVDPAPERDPKSFLLSDGVGCEACHGGASGWLASHNGPHVTHAQNVANGMVALDNPKVRAAVCLDCHFGSADANQFVSHRLMAAGHPRVSFELDLFSDLQRHYDLDSTYAQKKQIAGGVSVWAVGQAMALERALTLYAGSRGAGSGVFPEFYFFDCHACHRAISNDEKDAHLGALANPGRPIAPGVPPFNDSNIIMLMAAVRVGAPQLAGELEAQSRAFHAALGQGRDSAVQAASRLAATAHALADSFAARSFGPGETFAILDQIMSDTLASRYTDYAGSEQAVIAIERLKAALVYGHSVDRARADAIEPDIQRLFAATDDPNSFHPAEFRQQLQRVASAIRGLR